MLIALHKNATTTPAIRAEIQRASGSDYELAARFGVSRDTIRKWRGRDSVLDGSHTAHRLQTTLNAQQEELVVYLRQLLQPSLDDLLALVREFIEEKMSRSALDRLLRRRGVSRRPSPDTNVSPAKLFRAYTPGYVHVDVKHLPQMADETRRRYAFVAIDRATRWVYLEVKERCTPAAARSFLANLQRHAKVRIHTLLTDNGREFTDRLFGTRAKPPSGHHEFDQLCEALGIEHRLTRPRHPQTNGMVERFNGRLAEVLRTHRFRSGEELETTLKRYVWLYNEHLPQKALGHLPPIEAMKRWQHTHPQLFTSAVRNRPGPDN
jgi:transposase InsO family protein